MSTDERLAEISRNARENLSVFTSWHANNLRTRAELYDRWKRGDVDFNDLKESEKSALMSIEYLMEEYQDE